MCDFTKNYYIYSSCLDPGAHFFRTSVDGNRKLACPKGPHESTEYLTHCSHMKTAGGGPQPATTEVREGGNHGMMGARHSAVAAERGGKALAWSAEVTWSDDRTGGGGPSTAERSPSTRDEEWCTGSLGSASGAGAGGDVVLSWSWTSSWR
ncbi:hypothetical protein INS49_010648 [Diaporthe citri]|uniref:uncharacterized protein n=1 Tax=Diaporthe citri TaxID=83186 RepID=UPI001C7E2966|nr:uncharacterized protein INS49_010648 [Diaporthe citri]KAG6362418.1 hypothetical protein INS49_010648 [Diaporthe citri]